MGRSITAGRSDWLALATDYNGTIARAGIVDDVTREALVCFRATGRQLVLVTGRG